MGNGVNSQNLLLWTKYVALKDLFKFVHIL